ncbi:YqeG family HAD IIIA-type phosphatase [Atopococcus tabaci]|uniref:YqeG family HAD IIIA-type phosphatase n=1 Tax=Atopococcus tabaci TaxID=269774 RepID=UPI000405B01D|nr:YqeG family HAD IIIA-type phosphatase [Atopococcus tabaci]
MLERFKPTYMVESIYQITPGQLKKHGVSAVLTDLDNTLIAWDSPKGTEETLRWIQTMQEHNIPVVVLSNNRRERVGAIARVLGLEFVPRAMKPLQKGFKQAQSLLGFPKEELLMVGDQIMTDITGANKAGIRSVLVKPIVDSDAWNTRMNRFVELKIMNELIKHDPEMKWRASLDEPVK